jgi:hypothetical protein
LLADPYPHPRVRRGRYILLLFLFRVGFGCWLLFA